MSYLAFLGVIILFLLNRDLKRQVDELTAKVQKLLSSEPPRVPTPEPVRDGAPHAAVAAVPVAVTPVPYIAEESTPAPAPRVTAPTTDDRFVAWLQENWLMKIGMLLLLMALGWFLSYAFINNWIDPFGRITLGLVAGIGVLAFGVWRMRTYATQGDVFIVLGATTFLLTMYAGRTIYNFFTPVSALAAMFIVSAIVAVISGLKDRKQLGVMSVFMAGLAPILSASPTTDYVGLFMYLLIVVLGAVWIVVWKNHREVVTSAFIIVALYSLPLLTGTVHFATTPVLYIVYALAAIFYASNAVGLTRIRGNEDTFDIVTAIGNALLLIAWIYMFSDPLWRSFTLCAWAVLFLCGSLGAYVLTRRQEALIVYGAIAVGYFAVATAIEFHGAALTIAYILESAAVSVALFGITRNVTLAQRSTFLMIGPSILALQSIFSSSWNTSVFNQDFFVLALISAAFMALGLLFRASANASKDAEVVGVNAMLFYAGSFFFYTLVWLALHAGMKGQEELASKIAIAFYAFVGIVTVPLGMKVNRSDMYGYGTCMLVLAAALALFTIKGTDLVIAYTLEAALTALAIFWATGNARVAQQVAFTLGVPALLSPQCMVSNSWQTSVVNKDFFALFFLAAAFFSVGAACFWKVREPVDADGIRDNTAHLIFGSLFAFILEWLAVHAAMPLNPDIAVTICLMTYTAIGIGAYVQGVARSSVNLRYYGAFLVTGVVARLLIVDVWQMALAGRIITFFLVGLLLISTAFISSAQKKTSVSSQ